MNNKEKMAELERRGVLIATDLIALGAKYDRVMRIIAEFVKMIDSDNICELNPYNANFVDKLTYQTLIEKICNLEEFKKLKNCIELY